MMNFFSNLTTNYFNVLLFISLFSFSVLYFFNKNTLLELKEMKKKERIWFIILLPKVLLLAFAGTVICEYFKIEWLPLISPAQDKQNILSIVLTFIGISLAFLTGIAIFAFHSVFENFKERILIQEKSFEKKYSEFHKLEEKTKKQSNQILAFNIRSELYEKSFRAYRRVVKEKDNPDLINREITSVVPDIIPLFSFYEDKFKEEVGIKEALQVIKEKNAAIDLLKSLKNNPEKYIEDEIAPLYKGNTEITDLIKDVMKKLR